MPKEPYNGDARRVNRKPDDPDETERRRRLLASMDLVTTEDVHFALKSAKDVLGTLRASGLRQLGAGVTKQRFYRLSQVAAVLEAIADDAERDGTEAGGGET
jgi:hypothetical protein